MTFYIAFFFFLAPCVSTVFQSSQGDRAPGDPSGTGDTPPVLASFLTLFHFPTLRDQLQRKILGLEFLFGDLVMGQGDQVELPFPEFHFLNISCTFPVKVGHREILVGHGEDSWEAAAVL